MTYKNANNQYFLFIRIFFVLFLILFVMPILIDNYINMFFPYEAPHGGAVLVSNYICENMDFREKFLFILKNIIFSL